jgi:hypothetical protein
VWAPGSEMMFTRRFHAAQARQDCVIPVVAFDGGEPVARGVAIMATGAVDKAGRPQGWVGFFECLQMHPLAADLVLDRCEAILRRAGAETVLAPKVDNMLAGLLVKGFDLPHVVWTNHNPPYYLAYFIERGYQIETRMYSYYFTRKITAPADVHLAGFTTREFDRGNLERDIGVFHGLQLAIFGNRTSYIPRTLEEDRELVLSFLPLLQDDLVIFAEDTKGSAVGLLLCVPDLYQALQGRPINRVRVVSVGAIPRLADKGIGVLMSAHLMRNLLRKKEYVFAEGSTVVSSNVPPQNLVRRFHAEPGREFVLLENNLWMR